MRIDNSRARFLKKYEQRLKKVLVVGFAAGLLVCFMLNLVFNRIRIGGIDKKYKKQITELTEKNEKLSSQIKSGVSKKNTDASADELSSKEDSWSLVLINEENPLDTAYIPELEAVREGSFVDVRIVEDAKKMLEDAEKEGLNMYIVSAHRDYETQREVFNTTMTEWISKGSTPLEAYEETKKSVAVPGTSEHASGLAMDITSGQYGELDDKQAETDEAKWLAANCWKYGFILRYPLDKSDVTGIVFEPWHYRYVGKDAAKEIMEKDITLEEYLSN
ncbi:D-alanyl-D-alanine carboxypeptidase family protein [Schaedlerella arabinosiphila]|uniref:D-alanyl-D-alanine carboxypeptidase family protein n=1 Tax=Schaedlerella arabinosiphila TaxID=2044587 RepID=A0A3R8JSD2_9FIRM|nr:M15 family metallopeptidase [Schaedlerella arabinosiphila]RRK34894.1 D-alanyl-D-alanine carboxypeptidase family protein [Schaedlerella arabinosiphila]